MNFMKRLHFSWILHISKVLAHNLETVELPERIHVICGVKNGKADQSHHRKSWTLNIVLYKVIQMMKYGMVRKTIKDVTAVIDIMLLSRCCCCSVTSGSLRPHGPQHARPPCPSPAPEFPQTHVHRVGGAIQPSHPLSPPSPFALNLSQHQGLFQWDTSSHQVAKVLELQLQHQSLQWIFRTEFL